MLEGVIKFQVDRGLDKKEYEALNEHTNIVEELLESVGIDVPKSERENLMAEFAQFVDRTKVKLRLPTKKFTPSDQVDAYADIIVFSVGAIMKLGYDVEKVLYEASKEINSRTGEIINGKFEKDLSEVAKSKWYEANYSKCLIKGVKDGNNQTV